MTHKIYFCYFLQCCHTALVEFMQINFCRWIVQLISSTNSVSWPACICGICISTCCSVLIFLTVSALPSFVTSTNASHQPSSQILKAADFNITANGLTKYLRGWPKYLRGFGYLRNCFQQLRRQNWQFVIVETDWFLMHFCQSMLDLEFHMFCLLLWNCLFQVKKVFC